LDELEKKILKVLIRKKFNLKKPVVFQIKDFNEYRKLKLFKKNEDGIKFIYKKVIRGMKQIFKKDHCSSFLKKPISWDELSFLFYRHHFQNFFKEKFNILYETDKKKKLEVINFFEKKITIRFFKIIKNNTSYMNEVITFLEEKFIRYFLTLNNLKILNMVKTWEDKINKFGEEEGVSVIIRQVESPGNKIPWTLSEATHAFKHLLGLLKNMTLN
jgi:hypothetical protein